MEVVFLMLIRLNYGDPQLLADGWSTSGGRDRPGVTEDKYIVWFSISFRHTPNATIRVGPYVAAPRT